MTMIFRTNGATGASFIETQPNMNERKRLVTNEKRWYLWENRICSLSSFPSTKIDV